MTHWNDIQKKLQELEDAYKEKYGRLADDPLEPLGDSPEAGPLDKKAMEEKEAKEEAQEAQEAVLHWRCFVDFIQTPQKSLGAEKLHCRTQVGEDLLRQPVASLQSQRYSPWPGAVWPASTASVSGLQRHERPAQIEGIWQSFRFQRVKSGWS